MRFGSFVIDLIDQGANAFYFNPEVIAVVQSDFRVPEPAYAGACSSHDDRSLLESCTLRKERDGLRYSVYHVPGTDQPCWHER
jgi:hypothetical protein